MGQQSYLSIRTKGLIMSYRRGGGEGEGRFGAKQGEI